MSYIPIVDLSSLVASSELATFEISNIQNPLPSAKWRATNLTPYVTGQFSTPLTVTKWGNWYNNAQINDTVRLRLAATEATLTSAPTYDSGAVFVYETLIGTPPWTSPIIVPLSNFPFLHQKSSVPLNDQVLAPWWRIDYDWSTNTDGFLELSNIFLADAIRPVYGQISGWTLNPLQRGRFNVNYSGGGSGRGGGRYKTPVAFTFLGLSDAEAYGLLEPLLRLSSGGEPVGVVLFEAEQEYPMQKMAYGYLDVASFTNQSGRVEVTATVTEP